MTEPAALDRRLPAWLAWPLCAVLGVGLGWVGQWPAAWLFWTAQALAAEIGWGSGHPALVDDGLGILVAFAAGIGLVWTLAVAAVGVVGWSVTGLPVLRWWQVLGAVIGAVAIVRVFDLHSPG